MKNNRMQKSLLFFSLLFLLACNGNKKEYVINGTVQPKTDGDLIMLFQFRGDSIFSVDTTVIAQGTFSFRGEECLDDIAIVTTGNFPGIIRAAEVVLEKGEITVLLDSICKVSGTSLNDLYADHLQQKWNEENVISFCKENISNPVGRRRFKETLNNMSSEQIYEIASLVPDGYKLDPEIVSAVENHKKLDEEERQRNLLNGKKFINFELMTPSLEKKKLSDYIGQYKFVYVDFWSSYCGPCIADVPYLKKAYDKYHDKGLEIIHISLDRHVDKWRNLIEDLDAPWVHLSDLKGDSSEVKKAYHVVGIPHGVLIDQQGTVIVPYLKGVVLDQYLEMLFKQ